MTTPRVVLVLSGGAARGLAHIGVLDTLERHDIPVAALVGSSMGGLIGALSAVGHSAPEIHDLATSFHFPRWFVPGAMLSWDSIFPSASKSLRNATFVGLERPLLLTAVDLEKGEQTVLRSGSVLQAVRATCAVPGVLAPVRIDGQWCIDGGLLNILPVDVASLAQPDIVVGVRMASKRSHRMPELDWPLTSLVGRLGRVLPNPATAKVAFEILVRAAEIALDHSSILAASMTWPELMIEVDVGDIGFRDFHRLDEAVRAGRDAAERVLPSLERLIANTTASPHLEPSIEEIDPVCRMVTQAARARAAACYRGKTYYFCSATCRDAFEHEPRRYVSATSSSADPLAGEPNQLVPVSGQERPGSTTSKFP